MKRLLAGIMVVFMLLGVTACSKPVEQTGTETVQPEKTEKNNAEKAVKEYVEFCNDSDGEKSQSEGFSIELEARGTSVVYKYVFDNVDNLSEQQIEGLKQLLDKKLQTDKDSLQQTLKDVQQEESNVTSLIFEYYQKSGDLIASMEIE